MVVDESINTALNRIADAIEENNDVLNRIASHYDGVVPVMTRNAKRVEEAHEKAESGFLGNLFGEPETTN
jgi:methyl-accepting chemotaxis protein